MLIYKLKVRFVWRLFLNLSLQVYFKNARTYPQALFVNNIKLRVRKVICTWVQVETIFGVPNINQIIR